MNKYKINLASIITALVLMVGMPQAANAGMVGTHNLLPQSLTHQSQQQARQSIQSQLVALGLEPEVAETRVKNLSDQQVADISSQLTDLPAGADVGGILLTVFIVFVITDVIGATDIFPFIKPVR